MKQKTFALPGPTTKASAKHTEPITESIRGSGKPFTIEEVETLKRRRTELMAEGKQDAEISKLLVLEFQRTTRSIGHKIIWLVKSGNLPPNTYKQKQRDVTPEEIQAIKQRRTELMAEGKKDGTISKTLAEEFGRPSETIILKIHQLIESGELPPNPCKRKQRYFTPEKIETLKRRRNELMAKGKYDKEIARSLVLELQHSVDSIIHKIIRLVDSGDLEENPNNKKDFTPEEIQAIKQRRSELMAEGKKDGTISETLALELDRSADSIEARIRKFADKNPNKRTNKDFTPEEIETLARRRNELMSMGRSDEAISKLISTELSRSERAVEAKIRRLIKSGSLPTNPNKQHQKEYTAEELETIKRRRSELLIHGRSDGCISRILATEFDRSPRSIDSKIRWLVKSGELPENPSNSSAKPLLTDSELIAQLTTAVDVYLGKN